VNACKCALLRERRTALPFLRACRL